MRSAFAAATGDRHVDDDLLVVLSGPGPLGSVPGLEGQRSHRPDGSATSFVIPIHGTDGSEVAWSRPERAHLAEFFFIIDRAFPKTARISMT